MKFGHLIWLFLLSACAADKVALTQRIPGDPELLAARSGYENCVRKKLPDYDDGRAEPATVGKLMIGLCSPEYDFFFDNFIKGMSKPERKDLALRREDLQAKMVSDLVVKERAQTRLRVMDERRQAKLP